MLTWPSGKGTSLSMRRSRVRVPSWALHHQHQHACIVDHLATGARETATRLIWDQEITAFDSRAPDCATKGSAFAARTPHHSAR